jgi:hypothetical protein
MRRAVWNVKDRSLLEIEAFAVEQQKALPPLDIDGLFAVYVLARMPADRNLGLHQQTSPSREPRLRRDHERCLVILASPYPVELLASRHSRRFSDCLCDPF